MKLRNKKAQLHIVILVIGILAVCILAFFTFYLTDLRNRENTFAGLDKIQEANLKAEQGVEIKQIGNQRVVEEVVEEKYYVQFWREDRVLFRVRRFLD